MINEMIGQDILGKSQTYGESVHKKPSWGRGLTECMEDLLRDCDVFIFAALDIDAIDHFDGGSPEVCSDHVGKNTHVVLGSKEIHNKSTSRTELDRSIGGSGTGMHVGV
jgi:hypothetical protein